MKSISSWLLAGALAASLTWNWKLARAADGVAPPEGATSTECATGTSCDPEAAGLELSDEQRAALSEMCARSCGASDALEAEADALQRELLASLSAETVDPAATQRLVAEVSDLRRRSLAACVEGILGVRAVFSPEEVRALLASCGHDGGMSAPACR